METTFKKLSEERRKKIVDKIQKLLTLSGSSNEYEAALAASKAQDMLLRYNLSLTDVEQSQEKCGSIIYDIGSKMPGKWASALFVHTAEFFYCRLLSAGQGKYVLIGDPVDGKVACFTFDYLYEIVKRLANDFVARNSAFKDARMLRSSYSIGVAESIRQTLQKQKELNERVAAYEAKAAYGGNGRNALVVSNMKEVKEENIKEYMKEHFQKIKNKKATIVVNDQYAFSQGRIDGAKIPIRQGLE